MKIDLKFIKPVFEELVKAVEKAEVLFPEIGTGPDKRKFALDIICKLWSWQFPLNLFERTIFGLLIDLVVHLYNEWFGKAWVTKVPETDKGIYRWMGKE